MWGCKKDYIFFKKIITFLGRVGSKQTLGRWGWELEVNKLRIFFDENKLKFLTFFWGPGRMEGGSTEL